MTGYADKSDEVLASEFIFDTSQFTSGSSFVNTDHMQNLLASKSLAPTEYLIECGSNAEFYIRPLNPCIDDVDFLIAKTAELGFDGDFPVLPRDMSGLAEMIYCFKIEPYERYPGFVRLRYWGEMNYNWNCNRYKLNHRAYINSFVKVNLDKIADKYSSMASKQIPLLKSISGPAIRQRSDEHLDLFIGCDIVESVWCPQWPKEAQGWPIRPRVNGWPTTDVISEVVQKGCHVVCVNHRSCRDNEIQWRFSFSVAEVNLLQNFTQTQQIIYHLLRFFAKRELIQKNCSKEDEVLCTYHLKTLMLWTCEDMPEEWWNSASIILICCELLKKLAEWLKRRVFPNYFVPEANLFQDQARSNLLEKIVAQLNKYRDSGILSDWFVENYILFFIRRHLTPMQFIPHFMEYMQPVFALRKLNKLKALQFYFFQSFAYSHGNCRTMVKQGLNAGLRHCLMIEYKRRRLEPMELKKNTEKRDSPAVQNASPLTHLANLLYILHLAYGLGCGEISWDGSLCVEALIAISIQPKVIRSQYHNFPRPYTAPSSQFQFLRAQDLMHNLTGSNSYSEFQLLSLMAKQFIRKALKCDGTVTNRILPAALCYLAALRYATSEYQEATHLCSAVLMDQASKEDEETLNVVCLLFIDDVARIVGLCVLQKRIAGISHHCIKERLFLDVRLSPTIFAHYLSVFSAEFISKELYFYHALYDSVFPMDVNLKVLMKPKYIRSKKIAFHSNAAIHIVYRRPDSLIEAEASSVTSSMVKERFLDALMKYALENMASFYHAFRKDVGFDCNSTDCYRALYLYKCRQYDQVVHLCERILIDSDVQNEVREFSFANVLLFPPLDSFFDTDVQSFLGFHTLFYYLFPLNDDLRKVELTAESTFDHWFAHNVPRDLLFVLQYPYPIRSQYFLGRHFLARYLMLRCCIDCNYSCKELRTKFATQRINLPFEHIIRLFLLRKLRISENYSAASSHQF